MLEIEPLVEKFYRRHQNIKDNKQNLKDLISFNYANR